jgi:hypothetical protein
MAQAFARYVANVHHDGMSVEFDEPVTLVNGDTLEMYSVGTVWEPLSVTATRVCRAAAAHCADGQWSFVEADK